MRAALCRKSFTGERGLRRAVFVAGRMEPGVLREGLDNDEMMDRLNGFNRHAVEGILGQEPEEDLVPDVVVD